jgi:GalNAc-alpha-(1->4)-GalNAc-alpha-(1->3)-diNAcBac-PP-undecaprenol alpha-1,4-N-acetyl-D-galactosaminyltransferase
MKLLLAIKATALAGGGTERVVSQVSAALAERGHDVTLASFDRPGDPPFYTIHPSVRQRRLGIGDIGRGTGPGEAMKRIAALRRLALEIRPDVAVGFMHSSYIPLGLALVGTGIPLVASEHISYDHYRTRRFQAALLRLAPLVARAITVLSPSVRAGFPAAMRSRMTVVPNPVSVDVRQSADVVGNERPVKTLLAVGRLEDQKDHSTLIAAFARIAADFPDWRLRIVGEGVLRAQLEAQRRRLGLEDRVALPGAIRDVAAEYAAAQLFAMPSSYESFGLTTAEALGHGLPVIGFADCPGTNELIRDGVNGLLVAGPDRAAALADGLARLMASPELRAGLGAAGPASIEAFAPERVADIWEELLSRVASGRGPE